MSNTKLKILLTGATGFLGASVVKQIIEDGHIPIALLRRESNLSRLEDVFDYHQVFYTNLLDENTISQIKKYKPDVLIHLGWRGVAGHERNQVYQIIDNLELSLNTVTLASKVGCSHWIGIGSQAEYGNPNERVDELFTTQPTTLYGKAKLSTCWAALGMCQSYDLLGSWIRVFSLYGENDNPHWLIPHVIEKMSVGNSPKLTQCEQMWDYLYVNDAAKAVLSVVYSKVDGIFNLGSGKVYSLKYVIETIRELVNPDIQPHYGAVAYRTDQVMYLQADIRKLTKHTGWIPQMELYKGLEKMIKREESNV